MIQCSNPRAQYLSYKVEINAALQRVLDRGRYILDEEVRAFEAEFAAYIGVKFAVGVGSGTEALHLALRACGIGRGDEVITVSHTAVATVAAIELCGAIPVLVDIDDGYTLDPEKLVDVLTPRTKAVVPVHLYGNPAEMDRILEVGRWRGIKVIEDCAQAHGATYKSQRVGSLGDLACFSFYPTKNLGALGDGGMIVTDNPDLAEKAYQIREYGWVDRYVSRICGWNTRLDELQAAVLRVKLKYLDADNASRVRLAATYNQLLPDADVILPQERADSRCVYHLYVIRAKQRDQLQVFLREQEIGTLVHYPVPVHSQPAYERRLPIQGDLTKTECAAREVLSLPMYPELGEDAVKEVAEAILDFSQK